MCIISDSAYATDQHVAHENILNRRHNIFRSQLWDSSVDVIHEKYREVSRSAGMTAREARGNDLTVFWSQTRISARVVCHQSTDSTVDGAWLTSCNEKRSMGGGGDFDEEQCYDHK